VMWSEHCSYKSSRLHLRRLPTEGPLVLVGPGENAGVIDAGDGIAVAVRIESHNHPSAVEPHQGAATGVGGILRDIFTMGARPVATLDPLRFGRLTSARARWLFEGVVNGISAYGNSVGVPTVGGEVVFDDCYSENPLVNVMCIGVMPTDRLVLGRASGEGNLAVLLGSTTGRDGIGGVSVLASAGFGDDDQAKRPSVQVGDPFEEKRLIEACLALYDAGLVVGIQDLGGAGLTCATSETASRGGMGMDVDVSAVPRREPGMAPFEVMTSESQERMLAIVRPDDLDRVADLCRRWDVRATVVGKVNGSGRLRVLDGPAGEVLADVPAGSLHDDAPLYDRPLHAPADLDERRADDPARLPPPADCGADLLALTADL
jgi:phosphoribosylformylglycinamidine synthase II